MNPNVPQNDRVKKRRFNLVDFDADFFRTRLPPNPQTQASRDKKRRERKRQQSCEEKE
jgi:hypothetical protein